MSTVLVETGDSQHRDPNTQFATDDERWSAVLRRDAVADAAFVFAVRTTGVYCRPSCPARRPLRENVAFFAGAAAAEAAGFRPCKRCRPDGEGSFATNAAAVAQACRLIRKADEPPMLDDLARSVGLSKYHFQRLFRSVTGVTPAAYARAVRAERVRASLAQESGSVTDAILSAGFNSSGRFYSNVRRTLGMSVTDYRSGGMGMTVQYRIRPCWLGYALVAGTEQGVCAISLGDEPNELVRDLRRRFRNARLVAGDDRFAHLVEIAMVLIEEPTAQVDLPLDVQGTLFQCRVWELLSEILPGTTSTYSEIAARLGTPRAARAVARACATNPVAIAIPCHRVVRRDGSVASYRWGVERKRALLRCEADRKT